MGLHRYLGELDDAGRQGAKEAALQYGGPLSPAWIDRRYTGAGRLALSPLPGLPMVERSLPADLETLQRQGVQQVVCLLEDHEFAQWGVADLLAAYHNAGFSVRRDPIRDHSVGSIDAMRETVSWLSETLDGGGSVLVHCVGGLGRSGIVVACYLVAAGLSAEDAIAEVRRTRSPFAIETAEQEEFVRLFADEPAPQTPAAAKHKTSQA
jgi:protein-tyrosine phosphatase